MLRMEERKVRTGRTWILTWICWDRKLHSEIGKVLPWSNAGVTFTAWNKGLEEGWEGGVSRYGSKKVLRSCRVFKASYHTESRSAHGHAPLVSAGISLPAPIPWFCLFFFFLVGALREGQTAFRRVKWEVRQGWEHFNKKLWEVSFNSLKRNLIFIVFWEWWKKILLYSKSIFLIGSIYMNLGVF